MTNLTGSGVIALMAARILFESGAYWSSMTNAASAPTLSPMLPQVKSGDAAASLVFLAEGLKPKDTGKGTSAAEMSTTGVWSERDPRDATAEQGRRSTEAFVDAAVRFIERWKQLRPQRLR